MVDEFDNLNSAARLREAVRKMVRDEIEAQRPKERWATVTVSGQTSVTVTYPDEVSNPIVLPFIGTQPPVGATVRVVGQPGARYVDNVKSFPGPVGFKNYLINPTGAINQTGNKTITPGAGATYGGPDMWRSFRDGTAVGATSFSTVIFGPGNEGLFGGVDPPGLLYNQATTAPTGQTYAGLDQPIEDVHTLSGQIATLSYFAYSPISLTIDNYIYQSFGTGGSPSSNVQTATQSVVIPAAWTRVALTFTIPSINGKTLGTNPDSCLVPRWSFNAGMLNTVNYVYIVGAQLELGPVATRFEYRPKQVELALVQRYHVQINAPGGGYPFATGQVFVTGASANAGIVHAELPVPMRTSPAVFASAANTFYVWAANSGAVVLTNAPSLWSYSPDFKHIGLWFGCGAGLVAGDATQLVSNAANAYLDFSAYIL